MTGRAYFGRCGSSMVHRRVIAALAVVVLGTTAVAPIGVARAQTMSDLIAKKSAKASEKKDKLVVESKELVYDRDKNTVAASGNAQLYYQGRVLEADKVTYDRNTNRVFATGNAKLTEPDGQVAYGDRFELSDDFKNGFIDSLRVVTIDKTRFSAPRAERSDGETTVFEKGTYTACEPCKDDPSKPPLWQVRAKRIIHRNEERTVYYEDATLEFAGVPIAWVPYFSAPDATVKRKSGFLAPKYVASTALGYGISTPYFWALAPNYDLTITPTFMTRQGVLGALEWRHRLVNGSYNIRAAGIFQQDKSAFLVAPYGAGNKDFRGSIESTGKFLINDKWSWGWDVTALTDKWFLQNYKYSMNNIDVFNYTGFKEATSTLYLTGKGERSYFDLRGYYFQGLSYTDWQRVQPIVGPVVDYDRRFTGPGMLGGELALNANLTNINRQETDYFSLVRANGVTPGRYLFPVGVDSAGQPTYLYDTCAPNNYNPAKCYVRGVAGNYTRVSAEASWRRTFIDAIGQSWTPFGSLRGDLAFASLNSNGLFNQYLPNFIDTSNEVLGRVMPTAGVTYRYPFIADSSYGSHIIEPIAQLIVRPNEQQIGNFPNEDAQSLVYDDTTLFSVNKFSGYDRDEGGTRANYGLQYTLNLDKGGYGNVLFGQSYQLAGRNSYQYGDIARTGLDSGLDTKQGDYVGRIQIAPVNNIVFTGRGRFDNEDFGVKRVELQATGTFMGLTTSLMFAHYAAQPLLGYYIHQKGVTASAKYEITKNWYISSAVTMDLSRHATERFYQTYGSQVSNTIGSVAALSLGAGYQDECTTFAFTYSNSGKLALADGTKERVQTFMVRLELRTLGGAKYSYNNTAVTQDGISQ
jgi:LPS-assembly protein